MSSERLWDGSRRLAAGLVVFGAAPGDPVAVLTEDPEEVWRAEIASLACGACIVPVAPGLSDARIRATLAAAAARIVLVSPGQLDRVLRWRPELADLDLVILLRPPEEPGAIPATLVDTVCAAGEERLAAEPRLLEEARAGVGDADAACFVPCDGGAVKLTHASLLAAIRALGETFPVGERDRVLSFVPPDRVAGKAWHLACLCRGTALAMGEPGALAATPMEDLRPSVILESGAGLEQRLLDLSRQAVGRSLTASLKLRWCSRSGLRAASPALARDLLERGSSWALGVADRLALERIREATGGALRHFVSVDAPMSEARLLFFLGLGLPVLEGIGVPETAGVLFQNRPGSFRPGTVGRPVPGARVRVDDGGQVWVQGRLVARDGPEAGPDAARKSWFRTELAGVRESGGFLRLTRGPRCSTLENEPAARVGDLG